MDFCGLNGFKKYVLHTYKFFFTYVIFKYILSVYGLSFHSLNSAFEEQKFLILMTHNLSYFLVSYLRPSNIDLSLVFWSIQIIYISSNDWSLWTDYCCFVRCSWTALQFLYSGVPLSLSFLGMWWFPGVACSFLEKGVSWGRWGEWVGDAILIMIRK